MKIIIKDLRGKQDEISVDENIDISQLKSMISNKEEMAPKLIYNGKLLVDENKLKDYNIVDGSTIIKIERRKQQMMKEEEVPTMNTIKEATIHFKKEGEESEDNTVSKNIVEDVQKKLENLISSFFGQNNEEQPENANQQEQQEQQQEQQEEQEIPIPEVDQDSLENLVSIGFPESNLDLPILSFLISFFFYFKKKQLHVRKH